MVGRRSIEPPAQQPTTLGEQHLRYNGRENHVVAINAEESCRCRNHKSPDPVHCISLSLSRPFQTIEHRNTLRPSLSLENLCTRLEAAAPLTFPRPGAFDSPGLLTLPQRSNLACSSTLSIDPSHQSDPAAKARSCRYCNRKASNIFRILEEASPPSSRC